MNNPLKPWLKTAYIGHNVIKLDSIESTNNLAKDLLTKNPPNGTVIISKIQEKGKGQSDNCWVSPEGGLYYTCILKAKSDEKVTLITLACGVACCYAIADISRIQPELKWVNDIHVKGKKLGGILVESRVRGKNIHLITGIGINVNTKLQDLPENLQDTSTSMVNETGQEYDLDQLAALLSNQIEIYFEMYKAKNYKLIRSLWLKNSRHFAKRIRFPVPEGTAEGIFIDINDYGELIVQAFDGKQYALSSSNNLVYLD
jgi:BirA family transcriptional regulator, biotin operon repressor / biotin---[acetyl-CoA-carboxylase] ligase